MPEIPERQNPGYQGMDEVPEVSSTGGYAYTEREMNQKERAAYRRELKEKEARRIKPGFAIPPKEDEDGTASHAGGPAKRRTTRRRAGGSAAGPRRTGGNRRAASPVRRGRARR